LGCRKILGSTTNSALQTSLVRRISGAAVEVIFISFADEQLSMNGVKGLIQNQVRWCRC
jgi:hypothetical protein